MTRGTACGAVMLAVVCALHGASAQQKVQLGHATSATVSLRLVAAVGELKVVGWDRDSVDLSGVVPAGSRVEMHAGSPFEKATGMKMYMEPPTEATGREGRLILRVPRAARVWLKTGSADMDVAGVTGGLDLNVVGGSITVHGNPKELRAESMDGAVIVDGAPEWMRAKTATGDISLKGGQDVAASTISGAIRVTGGEVDHAKFESTTGAISLTSTVARGASIEIESHSGAIDIELPFKSSTDLDIATITGTIDNQWSRGRPVAGHEGRGMTFTSSGGMTGGRIVVRTFKGTVTLKPR
ncbi:MAG: hypothetical protein ABJE47_02645 [bacterium]